MYMKAVAVSNRVVNGPTSSGPNPARTRIYKPEPKSLFLAQTMPEKKNWKLSYVLKI